MKIRILPQTLVNRIAAGEVIERPASALKELLENSLDAGATEITVNIESGGRNLIAVTDNGEGMAREDLALAIERHATSKLADDDLLKITHFGFRGEALPSIGSVSRLTITSRKKNENSAWTVRIEGGDKLPMEAASCNPGTRVEIRDLFFATPARLKFLKSEKTEQQHIVDAINRTLMAHPEVSIRLYAEDKEILKIAGQQGDMLNSSLARMAAILGKDFAENSLMLESVRDNITIRGYAGLPTFNRGTSQSQYLFVNNRPVKDKLFAGAVRAAYQDFLGHDRYPVLALFLELPHEEVDVNVHPAKSEVRFRDSRLIHSTIVTAIRTALGNAGYRASNTVAGAAISKLAGNMGGGGYGGGYSGGGGFNSRSPGQFFAPLAAGNSGLETIFAADLVPGARPAENFAGLPDYTSYPLGAARCQLHETYIVAQTAGGIVIVDQHAAHERIVYEKMKESLAKSSVKTQKLLIPEIIEMTSGEVEKLLAEKAELVNFGLVIEKFGDSAVVIREVPALLKDFDIKSMIRNLTDDLEESGQLLSIKGAIEHVCGTIACHGSIRAGRRLNVPEMDALLREMESTPNTGQCNHGRPTYIELKLSDIEKLFGRK